MIEFKVQTRGRTDFVDTTGRVQEAVDQLDIDEGAVLVYVPHTTAAITINEGADPAVVRDIDMELGKVVPFQDSYQHAEGNSAAHIKSSLVGCSEIVAVSGGRLALGTWQKLWFCEFDGPRTRRLLVQRLGG